MNLAETLQLMGQRARAAAISLAQCSASRKSELLLSMAQRLRDQTELLLEANKKDLEAAEQNGLSAAMIDRLMLNPARIEAMASGVEQVASLADPVGEVLESVVRPNGIQIQKVRVPIGTICMIYESRPNVTVDAAVLCFKAGNATILRGGKEAICSNQALAQVLRDVLLDAGEPSDSIQLVSSTERESVAVLAGMSEWIDVIIPRGGRGLIETVVNHARMPVIKHYDGICHVYVHRDADVEMAKAIILDAKTSKPGVCNAAETLLIDAKIAEKTLPILARSLRDRNVELRGCSRACAIEPMAAASDQDWATEYLDLILSVKVVDDIYAAISHVNYYGSKHSEVIVTDSNEAGEMFLHQIDAACVYHNASTRFSDGGEFGFGAEIGISTDKLHARGPMGLRELTSYQFRIRGNGQTRH